MALPGRNPASDGYTGFTEVVASVSHFARARGLVAAGGWQVAHEGPAAPAQNRAWGLKPHVAIEERLLHVPGMDWGFLRFARITNAPQQPIRPLDARPWEPGGLWLLYTRAADAAAMAAGLGEAGWPTVRGVHGFDFGDLAVREVHHRGPDGLVLSVIEQQKPPLALPVPGLTHVFNAALVVKDFDRARRFFVDQLGFRPWMELAWDGDNPGLGLLADPAELGHVRRVRTAIVHPAGENLGSVELIGWDLAPGSPPPRDFGARGRPPNLGAMALRFAVADLPAHLAALATRGVLPARTPTTLRLEPYGEVRLAPVVAPDGVWLEFFDVVGP